jgi:PAS domain S-box-containing protein
MHEEAVPQPASAQSQAHSPPGGSLATQPARPVPLYLRLLFAAAVALSVVAGAAVLADLTALRRTSAQLDQFRVIQGTLERLLSTLVDAETGERGYLLTGRAVYLEPYVNATTIYPSLLADLEKLAAGDEEIASELKQLKPLIVARVARIESAIEVNKTQGQAAAIDAGDDGKRLMDEIRDIIGRIRTGVSARATIIEAQAGRRTAIGFIIALAAASFSVMAFVILYRAVSGYHRRRDMAENELRDSNALLQAVIQDTDDWVFIKDLAGRLVLVNPAVCKAFNRLPEDLVGKTLREYIPDPAEAERIRQHDQRVMSSGQSVRVEQTIIIDGIARTQLSTKTPRFDAEGNIVGLIGISKDITDRKHAELALEESNERLSQMVGQRTAELTELTQYLMRVSEDEKAKLAAELHDELGSLVTAIVLDAELVLKKLKLVAPELAARQETIVDLAQQAAGLKRRIIEGLRPLLLEQFGLVTALKDYIHQWTVTTGITPRQHFPEDPIDLGPDAALALYRVAQESLTNIAKYAQARNVSIELRQSSSAIVLAVEDDGIGIASEALARASSHGIVGMRHRVAGFGGTLSVSAGSHAKGTRITAELPLQRAAGTA